MKNLTPYMIWEDRKKEIISFSDLEILLDILTQKALATSPFSVELFMDDETGFLMTVGANESHVEFYSKTEHPPVVACQGDFDSDELFDFLRQGEPSSVSKRSCVSREKAETAIRSYFLTKKRPNNIRW
jgi:hypothetical protein